MKKIGIVVLVLLNILLVCIPIFLHASFKKELDDFDVAPTPIVKDINLDENYMVNIEVEVPETRFRNKIYYLYKNDSTVPDIDDTNWKVLENNKFSFELGKDTYYAFLKNEDGKIITIEDINNMGKV